MTSCLPTMGHMANRSYTQSGGRTGGEVWYLRLPCLLFIVGTHTSTQYQQIIRSFINTVHQLQRTPVCIIHFVRFPSRFSFSSVNDFKQTLKVTRRYRKQCRSRSTANKYYFLVLHRSSNHVTIFKTQLDSESDLEWSLMVIHYKFFLATENKSLYEFLTGDN